MLNPWISLAVYQTEMLICYTFFSAIFTRRMDSMRCLLVGFLLFAVGSVVNLLFGNNGVLNATATLLLSSLFAYFCFHSKFLSGVFYSSILTIINAALEIAITTTFAAVSGGDVKDYNSNLCLLIVDYTVCKGLFFLITLFLARMVQPKGQIAHLSGSLFFFPIAATICQTISWHILVQPYTPDEIKNLLTISSALLLFATILLFITYQDQVRKDSEAMQTKAELSQLQTEASYFRLLERQNEELLLYAHDAKKHLAAIVSLNNNPEVGTYAQKLSQRLADYTRGCHSGNKLLDVMIHKYSVDCETQGIRFQYEVKLCALHQLEEIDLVAVLGNLMDNAVTSAGQSQEKWLSLSTARRNSCDVLVVSNSCDIPPQIVSGRFLSTKIGPGIHGIGLRSVEKTLKKYQGDYDLDYDPEQKTFTATVMIPVPSSTLEEHKNSTCCSEK